MKLLGLDISTKTGWAIGTPGESGVETGKWAHLPHPDSEMIRWSQYVKDLNLLLFEHMPALAIVEGYGFANSHTLVTLVQVGTVLRYRLMEHKIPVIEVAPNALKKFVTGKGVAPKELMLLEVYKQWDRSFRDNDQADAFALYKFGEALLGKGGEYSKTKMEAVDKVRKTYANLLQVFASTT